jgi:hypothetical protein
MQLGSNESIAFSISAAQEPTVPRCSECDKTAWRIVGSVDRGIKVETPLCVRHFIDACLLFPVLQYLEREFRFYPYGVPLAAAFLPQFKSDRPIFTARSLPAGWTWNEDHPAGNDTDHS